MPEIATQDLKSFVEHWNKFKGAYFWTPPGSSSGRRSYEKQNSRALTGRYFGKEINLSVDVGCSCKNVYVTKSACVDGEKKTIASVKALIKRYEHCIARPVSETE